MKGLCTVVTCQPCVNCTNGNSKFLPVKVGGLGIDIGARVASPNKQPMVAGLLVIKITKMYLTESFDKKRNQLLGGQYCFYYNTTKSIQFLLLDLMKIL